MKTWHVPAVLLTALLVTALYLYGGSLWRTEEPSLPIDNAGPGSSPAARPVGLRGAIDADMFRQVADALGQGRRDFVIDSSYGGSVFHASLMAGLMRGSEASLTVTGACYSACALLLIGVEKKYYAPDADIRIHGARYKYPVRGQDDDAPARASAAFMVANGVPYDIAYGPGMGVNLHRLTPDELARMGVTLRVVVR